MFEALERMPMEELSRRHAACRGHLARIAPEAGGLAVFSRMAIYYLTGTWGNGVFWLPVEGEPVYLCRRGIERARLESPLSAMFPFKSYSELPSLLAEAGSPLSAVAAAEMSGLTWALSNLLLSRVKGVRFVPGDAALAKAMAVKSEWELSKMRLCGARHDKGLREVLPALLRPGMTERETAHKAWEAFFSLGHMGHMRMGAHGEEIFLGHVAAGDSGNYPSVFNGPVGLRGEHPAMALMGCAGKVWKRGEPLTMDIGFVLEGYHTDKTQVYWAGPKESIPDEARRAHDFCIEVQTRVAEGLRPGAIPSELYAMALDMARTSGLAEGFMGLGGNKVNFLGHGIGLAIDGWPVVARGFDEPLEAGMTLALEPKHGIPGLGMVGVENTFEVTESGGVCLTGARYDMLGVD
jgi:Xaa-Pro aminopeptidase